MNWSRCLWNVVKTAVLTSGGAVIVTAADPEKMVTDIAVGVAAGLVRGIFNWWKHRND